MATRDRRPSHVQPTREGRLPSVQPTRDRRLPSIQPTRDLPGSDDSTQPASDNENEINSTRVDAIAAATTVPTATNTPVATVHVDATTGKRVLFLSYTGKSFHPSLKVRAAATDIFQSLQDPAGVNWRSVPLETKELYWGQFKRYYTWDEEKLSTTMVKGLWEDVAAATYRDFVSGIKRLYYGAQKDRDKIRLQANVLDQWAAYWELPEVKAKSEQARKNRFSEPAGPGTGYFIHHGGSKCAELYAEEIAREKNCSPTECLIDTHIHFHYKEGEWTDKRAQWVMEEFERRVDKLPQPVSIEERNKIYLQVNRMNKRGRIIGQGNLSQFHASNSRSQHTSMTQPIDVSSNPTVLKLQEENQKLRSELTELRQEVRELGKFMMSQTGSEMGYTSLLRSPTADPSDPTE